jgi:hypothetical protein
MRPDLPAILKKSMALAWIVFCIFLYTYYSSRFSVLHGTILDNIGSLPAKLGDFRAVDYAADLFTALLGITLFSMASLSAGALLVSRFMVPNEELDGPSPYLFLSRAGAAFLAGHWLFSCLFMVLAKAEKLNPAPVAGVLMVGFLAGLIPTTRIFILPVMKKRLGPFSKPGEKDHRAIWWLSLGILFFSLMLTSSRLGYDSVYIYFSDPKLTALSGKLNFFLNDLFVVSSFQTGIEYSANMLLFGDQAARMFTWVSGCLVVAFSLGIAQRVGLSNSAKAMLLALIMSSTAFTDLLGDGKVDLTNSAIVLASVYWMTAGDRKSDRLLAGFFAGLAMATRPYNIFLLAVFIATLYLLRAGSTRGTSVGHQLKALWGALFWIGVGSILPLAVHLAENWLFLGDPFAMLANTQNITSEKWQWTIDPQTLFLMRLTYPFVVTFVNNSQSIGSITPLFLAILPCLLIEDVRKKVILGRPLIGLLIASLITLLLWITLFFTIMETRYVFFIWITLFIPAAEVLAAALNTMGRVFQGVIYALVLILLGFLFFRTLYIALDTYSPLDPQGNPQCSGFVFCDYLAPINDEAPSGERVLSLLAYRYYLRTDLFACSTKTEEYDLLRDASAQDTESFWEEVYRQGYVYIAYEENYTVRHLYMDFVPDPAHTPGWLKLETLYGGPQSKVAAYRIVVSQPPVTKEKICTSANGRWEVTEMP